MTDPIYKVWFPQAYVEDVVEEDENLIRAVEEIEAEEQGGCSICLEVPMTANCNNAGCDR